MRKRKAASGITRREFLRQTAGAALVGAGVVGAAAPVVGQGEGAHPKDEPPAGEGAIPGGVPETAMKHRELGRTGLWVGAIGLGTEHIEQTPENIAQVVRTAVAAGVNYIDVLYEDPQGAAAFWDSFAPAVREHREKLILAAHWGPSYYGDVAKSRACLEDILGRVGNDRVEVAIIAVIDRKEQWDGWGQRSAEALLRYRERGAVGHIGMSGHYVSTAKKAIESGLVDVVMFPINLLIHGNREMQELYETCASHKVGLVAMKPYSGATLFQSGGKATGITPTQCLSYVLSQPVATTVPGASNAEELRKTLHYLSASDQEKDYRGAIAALPKHFEGVCVRCNHCQPCPQGIDIATMMLLLGFADGGVSDDLREWYQSCDVPASACVECGACMERCPFKVDIINNMKRVAALFEVKRS